MKGRFYLWQIEVNESLRNGFRIGKPFFVDVCCNVNTINTKEGDNLKITMQIKLQPTKEEMALLDFTMQEYISLVNDILDYAIASDIMPKLTSKTMIAPLPSALKAQCYVDAKSIYNKTLKYKSRLPALKKPVAIWNNQNYTISDGYVAFPLFVNNKVTKTKIAAIVPRRVLDIAATHKLGTLRITKKSDKYIAQIAYEIAESAVKTDGNVMGIDLGIKCPAVAVTSSGKTKFYGNGRQNKQKRRKFAAKRKKLGKAKKLKAIKKSRNKEQRWMTDQDHKISRAIVNNAVANGVKIIKLEKLSGIRQSARTSRKNNHSLHNWSFYRLAKFIEYKAALAGIEVVYVNPAYTSQTCPCCGKRNHANDRNYVCSCGYHTHRDRLGAVNILTA